MLEVGMNLNFEFIVDTDDLASSYGSGTVNVLATPCLISIMENVSSVLVEGHLEKGFTTVGAKVEMNHLKATPLDMKVIVKCTLTEIDGKKLTFDIEAFDEVEKISTCKHKRFIVNKDSFEKSVSDKLN